jgi:hypothetical protein
MDFCTGDIANFSLITSKQHSKALQDERGYHLTIVRWPITVLRMPFVDCAILYASIMRSFDI